MSVLVNIDPDTLRAEIRKILAEDATAPAADPVSKGSEEQRFVLGIAYRAGIDPAIAKGLDGGRDFLSESELEKAAFSFLTNGPRVGLFHLDGTDENGGAAQVVESYIYRNEEPWDLGDGLVVRKGDWVVGAILSPKAWSLYKAGRITGWSMQGVAKRRKPAREAS